MDSATNAVLSFVHNCLQAQQNCWLITVVKTWGAAPRLPGACFAWSKHKGSCGSLSGGCIEDDLVEKLDSDYFADNKTPFIQTYGIHSDDAQKFGLPCGGKLDILMEQIPATSYQQQHFAAIYHNIKHRQGVVRTVDMNMPFESKEVSRLSASKPQPLAINQEKISVYLGPKYRLLMIGANQVAHYLAEFASTLDFECWVCDPRENAFQNWPISHTENFTHMPDDLIRDKANDDFTAIVTLSHDPRVDDMALMEALTTNAFYIGAMGSKKTTAARLERLKQLDLTPQQLSRLIAPIGLPIRSKTPAEIAMSIAADLIKAIRQKT